MTPRYHGPDRRRERRRDDDTAEHEILQGVVAQAPKVSRLETAIERAGRFGGALMVLGALIGGTATAFGMSIAKSTDQVVPINARVDSNQRQILLGRIRMDSIEARQARRLDSVLTALGSMSRDIATIKNVQCAQLEREKSDLQRFGGCKENR